MFADRTDRQRRQGQSRRLAAPPGSHDAPLGQGPDLPPPPGRCTPTPEPCTRNPACRTRPGPAHAHPTPSHTTPPTRTPCCPPPGRPHTPRSARTSAPQSTPRRIPTARARPPSPPSRSPPPSRTDRPDARLSPAPPPGSGRRADDAIHTDAQKTRAEPAMVFMACSSSIPEREPIITGWASTSSKLGGELPGREPARSVEVNLDSCLALRTPGCRLPFMRHRALPNPRSAPPAPCGTTFSRTNPHVRHTSAWQVPRRVLPVEPPQMAVRPPGARRAHELLLRHHACRCLSSPSASGRPRTRLDRPVADGRQRRSGILPSSDRDPEPRRATRRPVPLHRRTRPARSLLVFLPTTRPPRSLGAPPQDPQEVEIRRLKS